MYTLWRLMESYKVLKSVPSVTFIMLLAILVVIATITATAKIAFEDPSWAALFFLLVTIIQVLKLDRNKDVWGRRYAPSYDNCCVCFVLGDTVKSNNPDPE